jgi:hypothetical protein
MIGVMGFGFLLVGVTCVSPPLFLVNLSGTGLIVHAYAKWTLVAGQHSNDTHYILGAPGCRYLMPQESYVHRHDTVTTFYLNLLLTLRSYVTAPIVRSTSSALQFKL